MTENPTFEAALEYASKGIHVFPLHSTDAVGACSCGKADCGSAGKHPRTLHGHRDATTDPEQIRRWWSQWPDANVGIATGPSGIVVYDIDDKDDRHGTDAWRALVEKFGPDLEDTTIVDTPSGGFHIYYRAAGRRIASKNKAFGPGIDLKAQGGYVVAPPSMIAGRRYAFRERGRRG
jgi:putative DNA primase/helicase